MKEGNKNVENTEELFEKLASSDLHFLNESEIYQELIRHGYKQAYIGNRLGKSQSAIGNKLRLLNLSQACKNMIIVSGLSERHARTVLTIRDEDKRMKTLKHIIDKNLTVKKAEKYINSNSEMEFQNEDKANMNSFIATLGGDVKRFKRAGLNIMTGTRKKDAWTDILIRVYK